MTTTRLRPTRCRASALNLTDVSLVGFSMGTGEVTRYIGNQARNGCARLCSRHAGPVSREIADNPEGVDRSVFDGIKAAIKADRPTFYRISTQLLQYDVTGGTAVSERVLETTGTWPSARLRSARWLASIRGLKTSALDIPRNTVTDAHSGRRRRSNPADRRSIRRQAKMMKNTRLRGAQGRPAWRAVDHAEQSLRA